MNEMNFEDVDALKKEIERAIREHKQFIEEEGLLNNQSLIQYHVGFIDGLQLALDFMNNLS